VFPVPKDVEEGVDRCPLPKHEENQRAINSAWSDPNYDLVPPLMQPGLTGGEDDEDATTTPVIPLVENEEVYNAGLYLMKIRHVAYDHEAWFPATRELLALLAAFAPELNCEDLLLEAYSNEHYETSGDDVDDGKIYEYGHRVELRGLKNKFRMNGMRGMVLNWDSTEMRCRVLLPNGKTGRFKNSNLVLQQPMRDPRQERKRAQVASQVRPGTTDSEDDEDQNDGPRAKRCRADDASNECSGIRAKTRPNVMLQDGLAMVHV
jgi:hypothetical protein